jgi:hypothetical protein
MHVVVEATDYQPDAIREKNYRSLSFAGSAATTDARSCIVVDVVAIRNSFGFVDRRHPVSGASKVVRAWARRAGRPRHVVHYFSLRDH